MSYSATVRGERYSFGDLACLLAKANDEKSGDQLAGIAAADQRERVAAKMALADVPLREIVERPVIDPDTDDVTRAILDHHDAVGFASIQSMTVGQFREFLLRDETTDAVLKPLHRAITPEIAAAVVKIMSNKDLIVAASKIRNVTRCRNTMGLPGTLGIRLQPNHPADSLDGILLSTLDGLLFGCGDAVIGVNPATESVETVGSILHVLQQLVETLQIPTQTCVLSHVTTQLAAMERGAPVDLLFQSIAGTQRANESFGTGLAQLDEGRQRVLEHHQSRDVAWIGSQVMYFETGKEALSRPRPITAWTSSPWKRVPTASPDYSIRSWSTRSSASSGPNTSTTKGKFSGRGWKITSWGSFSACRWDAMSATPTTPMPIRTPPTGFS